MRRLVVHSKPFCADKREKGSPVNFKGIVHFQLFLLFLPDISVGIFPVLFFCLALL